MIPALDAEEVMKENEQLKFLCAYFKYSFDLYIRNN
jgi:hypothetical protein